MRITNKIIQNNSLTNINTNRVLQDKLSTQVSTGKKIARPSEDPIVALRSLRLRTNANQTEQYLKKNVEDAESWLEVTEDAIDTLSSIITDIRKQFVKGNVDSLTVSDRNVIRENIEALQQEIYNTGNADFAGRSVFTGYRTESPLTFQSNVNTDYEITESFLVATDDKKTTMSIADKITYVHTGDVTSTGANEQDVYSEDITRLRLAYKECKDGTVTFETSDGTLMSVTTVAKDASPDPYETVVNDPDAIVYVPETGEVLLGKNVAADPKLSAGEVKITYHKDAWLKGDLRPEHYFPCKDITNGIDYNESDSSGEIEYNIGVNQTLRVNTLANECFNHDISREIHDLLNTINDVEANEEKLAQLQKELAAIPETDTASRDAVQVKIDAARKAQTYLNAKLHNQFSNGIANSDNYLDRNNLALTNSGTRSKRLELIKNRLETQKTTIDELKSENEDADLAETAIKLSSAGYSYNAALMATGKIVQESLLNYL